MKHLKCLNCGCLNRGLCFCKTCGYNQTEFFQSKFYQKEVDRLYDLELNKQLVGNQGAD